MLRLVMITLLLLLSTKHTHGTEWDCTGASNTGTFQRSTGCTISGTTTTNGGGVVVTNTLEIVGTVEDMNHLIVITAASKQRHFYVNGVNNKLVLRYVKLTGGDVSSYRSSPDSYGGSICIYRSGGTLLLYSSIIANNQAYNGGAILALGDPSNIEKTNVIVNSSIITGNNGDTGGYDGIGYGGGCFGGFSCCWNINLLDVFGCVCGSFRIFSSCGNNIFVFVGCGDGRRFGGFSFCGNINLFSVFG